MLIMVLAVTIIVMIGSLLGVLYYFAVNVDRLNPTIADAPVKNEVIIVATNKKEYERGETVKIQIKKQHFL